jgi:transposase
MRVAVIGLDIAKNVFQVHGADEKGRPVLKRRLRRAELLRFFAGLEPCRVSIEACHSSHYWAREITKRGHDVRLIPTQYVRAYVRGGKNDANDSAAICEAVSRPTINAVAIKTAEQQAIQSLHRMRERLIHERTAKCNQIRSLVAEEGLVCPIGIATLRKRLAEIASDESIQISALLRRLVRLALVQLQVLEGWIQQLNEQVREIFGSTEVCKRLAEVLGIGPVIATAVVGTVGDPRSFKNGRQFAAWLGLTPRQRSSGNRTLLLGVTKQGDTYLRTLFVQGARAALQVVGRRDDAQSRWLKQLLLRRHKHVVAVALANKLARVVWALLAKGESYQPAM